MKRLMATALAAVTLAAHGFPATDPIDLDRPESFAKVEHDHPEHLGKIRKILSEAPNLKPAAIPGWIRTEFDASDVSHMFVEKTSYPPKARLSFKLDDVRYSATITLRNVHLDTMDGDTSGRFVQVK